MENTEEYAYLALKNFLDKSTENITLSATVNRALIDRVSTEIVNTKVNNQANSIQASMFQINPKFTEKSKHYDYIKKEIDSVLADYENVLEKCCDNYDTKIEGLLMKKVELESHLVGKIFKEEKYKSDENKKEKEKETDKLKNILEEKNKKIFEFISNKKDNLDVQDVRKFEDSFDLEKEQNNKLSKKVKKIQEENKTNMSEIAKIEIDLKNLNNEIESLCNEKRLFVEKAMETEEKEISKTVKKPNAFSKIKRFFVKKFNTYKVIENSVIEPLKFRISEFNISETNI